ncbi:hypothetical protein TIFTF001_039244 [Ficus carica]|uniref:Uncharacterized protein n=1 Tax=Ficus carica TaxID=3494 RepID=A0AA88EJG0_FICCA|nr:hypothetical protein TIFTF001_039244 [Ficus carica]
MTWTGQAGPENSSGKLGQDYRDHKCSLVFRTGLNGPVRPVRKNRSELASTQVLAGFPDRPDRDRSGRSGKPGPDRALWLGTRWQGAGAEVAGRAGAG